MKSIQLLLTIVLIAVHVAPLDARKVSKQKRSVCTQAKRTVTTSKASLHSNVDAQDVEIAQEITDEREGRVAVAPTESVVVGMMDEPASKAGPVVAVEETSSSLENRPVQVQENVVTNIPEPTTQKPTTELLADQNISSQDILDDSQEEDDDNEEEQQPVVAKNRYSQQSSISHEHQVFAEKDFDIEAKVQAVMDLLDAGQEYLKKNPIDQAFSAFSHDQKFIKGELYLFVYDNKGVCLAHGNQNELIWQNLYNLKDTYGTYIVREFLDKARVGGGWVTYEWRHATKVSYVKEVRKGDKTYVIGCGYYPHSKQDAVVTLVKGAVSLFNEVVKQGRPKDEAFSTFSYTLGRFTLGDLYLYALDFHGLQLAHGELPGVVGTSGWTYRDSAGKLVNQEIISRLKDVNDGNGIWVDYISKNAPKRTYAEKVTDKEGKHYFIACGYYPDADRNEAVNLVRRAYAYMKRSGKTEAVRSFTDKDNNEFRYGDLYIVVYNLKGVCVAHGGNSTLVGKDLLHEQDSSGYPYVREIVKKAQAGGGWVDYKEKNSFKSTYVEMVNMGVDKFVICCGLYPITKRETMILIAKSGADYVRSHSLEEAMREIVARDGKFTRGDLDLFVYDMSGICLGYSDDYDMIWRNFMRAVDQTGKAYVKIMTNTVQKGAGTLTYKLNDAIRLVYVEPVQKDGKTYIVGSGFYF